MSIIFAEMYSKQELSRIREEFWTSFGRYMQPILSADGEKVNWVNYKTGVPGIAFRMNAENKGAVISIVVSNSDAALRSENYRKLLQLKDVLEGIVGEQWTWAEHTQDEYGKERATISKELPDVSINNTNHWPELISFFKPRIIALDEFWSMAKYGFEL